MVSIRGSAGIDLTLGLFLDRGTGVVARRRDPPLISYQHTTSIDYLVHRSSYARTAQPVWIYVEVTQRGSAMAARPEIVALKPNAATRVVALIDQRAVFGPAWPISG